MAEQDKALYTADIPTFKGSATEKDMAERVYNAMMMQGLSYPQNVPIRQTLTNLATFFASTDKIDEDSMRSNVESAVKANKHIFQRSQAEDDEIIYATSRLGYYNELEIDNVHTFAQRLYEPEHPLPVDDLEVVITRTRPPITMVEPLLISDYWQQRSPDDSGDVVEEPAVASDDETVEDVVVTDDEVEEPAAVVAEQPSKGTITSTRAPSSTTDTKTVVLEDGSSIDLRKHVDALMQEHGANISTILQNVIAEDPLRRVVSFGNEFYPEDAVISLSKGDLRRIREYILEQGEPMPDTAILNDVYYKTPREDDWATFRFALNYRLNREKDFEFVGVQGSRLWSAKGLAAVGTRRLKTSELGQFYSFLEEGQDDSVDVTMLSSEEISELRQLTHTLSFFEWEYGVLPYNDAFKALYPPALLDEQRTAILRFEAPQHYTVYLAELRYPTNNRGGWIHGLEDFFKQHLVPGTVITIAGTDDPSIWLLQYEETNGVDAKLLQQDDKKNRYSFSQQTFYSAVDISMLPSQERLTRLKNMKVLPSGERRRIVSTVAYVLEHIGQARPGDTPGFELDLNDVYLATNVQRPASKAAILNSLGEDENFLIEDDTIIYFPPPDDLPQIESDEEEE